MRSLFRVFSVLSWAWVSLGCATPGAAGRVEQEPSGLVIHGQMVPARALRADPRDFEVPAGVAVLHYYGNGGWGIRWGKTYVMTAPYFSHHGLPTLFASGLTGLEPDVAEVRAGFMGTPVAETSAVLIGHGHVDHAGDVPAFFAPGLIASKPALIADRSTTNLLATTSTHFGCVAAIDYRDPVGSANKCPLERVRITPVHHAHAPHLNLVGLDVAAYGGRQKEPLHALPTQADDYKLGTTWAYLIDLLDEQGKVVFRIHYTDAAGTPPHGLAPASVIAQRDVDVAIACVPGFEQSDDYPSGLIENQHVRYVLAAHWEDFFQPRQEVLTPLRQVLDAPAIERFINGVEAQLPQSRGMAPLNKGAACSRAKPCGPRGKSWALPVPGETFHFQTSKGPDAVSLLWP